MNIIEYDPTKGIPKYCYLYVGSNTGELYLLLEGYPGAGELRLGWRGPDDFVEPIELIDQWVEVVPFVKHSTVFKSPSLADRIFSDKNGWAKFMWGLFAVGCALFLVAYITRFNN